MRTVYKYPLLPIGDNIVLSLPAGATVLSVQVQHGEPCVWALVDTDAPLVKRSFRLAGTGHPLPNAPLAHLGTFQLEGGSLVFHLLEVRA